MSATAVLDVVPIDVAPHEIRYANHVGGLRQTWCEDHGLRSRNGPEAGGRRSHCVGALGELVVAKALGAYWNPRIDGPDRLRDPERLYGDVLGYQVRATERDDGRLILHDEDRDRAVFVLVTGAPPRLYIRGWIYGADGKASTTLQRVRADWRAAYFVPHAALLPWIERPFVVGLES